MSRIQIQGTVTDIARDHGITKSAVEQWGRRYADFPKPLRKAAAGALYDLTVVDRWAAKRCVGKHRP